jgi:phosphoribosylformylglycinamidine synthase subunit PurS
MRPYSPSGEFPLPFRLEVPRGSPARGETHGCDETLVIRRTQPGLPYNERIPMKALVYVSLKRSVLDPQGKTIQGALNKMGYKGLQDVRQGKYFEITLDGGLTRNDAEAEIGKIAREVLTNPVIEEFRYSLED